MMTLSQFRQRYPQYADRNDEEIAAQLHAKFHGNEDYNAFRSKFLERAPVEESQKAIVSPPPAPTAPEIEEPEMNEQRAVPTASNGIKPIPQMMEEQRSVLDQPDTVTGALIKRSGARLASGVLGVPDLVARGAIVEETGKSPLDKGQFVARQQKTPAQLDAESEKKQQRLETYGRSAVGKLLSAEGVQKRIANYEAEAVASLPREWQHAIEKRFIERDEAGELQLGEGAGDPKWYAVQAIDMGLMMAPGIGTAGVAARGAYAARYAETLAKLSTQKIPQSVALTAARKAGQDAAMKAAVIAGGLSEGGVAGSLNAQQVREMLNQVDEETMMGYEPYKELRQRGLSHEAARDRVAVDQAIAAGAATAIVTGLSGAPLNAMMGRWFAGGRIIAGKPATTVAGKVVERGKAGGKAALVEGGQETVQEGFDQLASNLAEGPITGQSPWAGVTEAGLTGGWLGALMGGGMGGIAGPEGPSMASQKPGNDLDARAGELAVARENYAALIKPGVRTTQDQIDEAKTTYEAALVALGRAALRSGQLPPDEQQKLAEALAQAPQEAQGEAAPVAGTVREKPKAAAPVPGVQGKPASTKRGQAEKLDKEPLSEVETARQDALNRVANADTIEETALTELVAGGMAKINPQTGRPILLPPGKRQRTALNKRAEAAEAAEKEGAVSRQKGDKTKAVVKKPQSKPAAKPAVVAAKPQVAKPATLPAQSPARLRKAAKLKAEAEAKYGKKKTGQEPMFMTRDDRGERETLVGPENRPLKAGDKVKLTYGSLGRPRPATVSSIIGPNANLPEGAVNIIEDAPGAEERTVRPETVGAKWTPTVTTPVREARRMTRQIAEEQAEEQAVEAATRSLETSLEREMRNERKARTREKLTVIEGDRKEEPMFSAAEQPERRAAPTTDRGELERRQDIIAERQRVLDRPVGAGDAAQTISDEILNRPGEREAAARRVRENRAKLRGSLAVPAGFRQDNPGLRDEQGRKWLKEKQRNAEEDMATAKKRGIATGSMAHGIGGAITANVTEADLPTSMLATIPGTGGEQRGPGEAQFDRLMENVRKEGFNQEKSPILVMVNHKGEALIHEGNTRVAVAKAINAPTVRAEVRWWNGGEMVDGTLSPAAVKRMTEPEAPMFSVAQELPAENEPLLAPNGKPSKLTRAQWQQVRTPEFKRWFGEWEKFALMQGGVWNDSNKEVSKAVDNETGEPLVVYHGTKHGGFRSFSNERVRFTDAPRGSAFFTDSRRMAATYAHGDMNEAELDTGLPEGWTVQQGEEGTPTEGEWVLSDQYGDVVTTYPSEKEAQDDAGAQYRTLGYGPVRSGIYSVFLNIRDPNEANFEGTNWNGDRAGQWMVVARNEDGDEEPIYTDDGRAYFVDRDEAFMLALRKGGIAQPAMHHGSTTNYVVREAIQYKNDGAVIRETVDEGTGGWGAGPADVWVALDPTQIKSATQNVGTFDPKSEDIMLSAAPMFYSALTRAAENAKMNKGSAEQWYGALKNTPGVKQEELDWSGVKEWLGDRKGVTKEDVMDYLRANQLLITEQELVPPKIEINRNSKYATARMLDRLEDLGPDAWASPFDVRLMLRNDGAIYSEVMHISPELKESEDWELEVTRDLFRIDGRIPSPTIMHDFDNKANKATKYVEKQLPGGTGYRMILLQLPDPTPRAALTATEGAVEQAGDNFYIAYDVQGNPIGQGESPEAARENAQRINPERAVVDTFLSPHFPDDRNVVAHIRLNERTDTDGNTYIFAETIQSDWHQQGRRGGYRGEKADTKVVSGLPVDRGDPAEWAVVRRDGSIAQHGLPTEQDAIEYARFDYEKNAVPDAPFKTTWPELVMKRLIRYAAEHGYNGIGWTTGEQQAERWGSGTEEGMQGFYDEILPHAASKIGKKYGAKVAIAKWVDSGTKLDDGIPILKRGEGITFGPDSSDIHFIAHGMLLTPELKTAALGGFPMFAVQTAGGGASVAEIEAVLAEPIKQIGVPVQVVATQNELPGNTPAFASARGLRVQGMFYPPTGELFIVAENTNRGAGSDDAATTYYHEVVGHKGLRALLGPEYDETMDAIAHNFPLEMIKAGNRNGINWKKNLDQRRKASEEAVAYAAGGLLSKTGGKDQRSIWRKMVDTVRAALLKRKFLKKMKPNDLLALIYRARSYTVRAAAQQKQAAWEAQVETARDKSAPIPKPDPVNDGPLLGMPTRAEIPGVGEVEIGPFAPAREAAARYQKQRGSKRPEPRVFKRVNVTTAKRIADAYQNMKHDPLNPRVKAAYEALARETLAQYQIIKQTGLKVEFIGEGQDPYAASPRLAIEDVKNNNHLWVFPTDAGFGGTDPNAEYLKNNPLLEPTDEYIGRRQLLVNDVFRIVHDYFGHVKEGNGFRHDGEENAWRQHAAMFSPLARAAMTSETRGQNSWLNFGPHGDKNRTAKSADTVYAEQKIGLLPPEFWNPEPDGSVMLSVERHTPLPSRALARKAHAEFQRQMNTPGGTGFAMDIRGNPPPKDGYMLSTDKTSERTFQTIPSVDDLTAYIGEHRAQLEAGGNFFGGWIAEQNRFVVDTSIWMADEAEALAAGAAAKQEAIYDLMNGRVIYIGQEPMFSVAQDDVDQTISEIAGMLTPAERESLNRATAQKLVDLFDALPDEKERGAVALAGQAARNWYRDSARTIADIFGPDSPRFVALLAALSPQVDVAGNLKNTVNVWSGWVQAGRPADSKAIKGIMAKNLWNAQNRKGVTVGVLPAWINNTLRALQSATPESIVLSGPKVSSFAANLRGEVNEVTLDSWMAAFDKLDAKQMFGGGINAAGTQPGKRAGYLAVSARIRQTAAYLTKRTGETWTPAEVQETIWAWTKTLAEVAAKFGPLSSAEQIIKDGDLTNELVNATTNFATLFALPEHAEVLRNLGHGAALDRAADRAAARREARSEAPPLSSADQQRVLTAARRLDALRAENPNLGRKGGAALRAADQGDIPFSVVDEEQEAAFSVLGGNTGNPDLDTFLGKIGDQHRTLGQWWQDTTENLGARAQMGVFDDLYGIKRAGDIAGLSAADVGFKNAHLAKSAAELTQALIEYGHPVWHRDGTHMVAGVEGGQGLIDILKPLGEKVNLWSAWMVARRASRLMGEGRENLFLPNEIAAALALGGQHPEFAVVAKRYAEFQKKVLDFAQEAGVIDPNTRALWEHADYVPFYRIIENNQVQGPSAPSALGKVRNQIRKLRGGKARLGDPLENIAQNWHALMDASLKAHAARTVVDALDGSGLVTRAPQVEITSAIVPRSQIEKFIKANPSLVAHLQAAGVDPAKLPPDAFIGLQKMLAVQPPSGEDIISVWRNGKREYWHVHDDLLFESLMNVNRTAWGPLMEIFRYPKRLGTALITSTPGFGIKNFWRDMWHTFIQGAVGRPTTIVPGLDSVKGAISQIRMDATSQSLLAGGGSFTHGYIRGGDTRGAAATIRRSLRKLNASSAVLDTPAKLWRFYRDMLNAAENSHRVAMYNRMRAVGASRLDATYEARDLLDFSKTGNNAAVRFLTESVMFLNARAQGLHRLARGPGGSGKALLSIAMRGTLYMFGVLSLFFKQKDDERYKALTNADKTTYLHFFDVFAEGDHYRLPVPFEVGTIFGTTPIAIAEAFTMNADEPDRVKQALSLLGHAYGETLSLSPDIQALWPIIELGINRDTFTQAPILTMGDEAVLPEQQDDPRLSPTIRELAKAMPGAAPEALRSPKQLAHLARGYFGTALDYALFASDAVVRRATGVPPPPERNLRDYPDVRAFVQTGPLRATKYNNAMFEIASEADKVAASIRKLEQLGTDDALSEINELQAENAGLLAARDSFIQASKTVVDMRKAMRQIQADDMLTPTQKRTEIDVLQLQINEVAYSVWDLRPGGKLNPDVAIELLDKDLQGQVDVLLNKGYPDTAEVLGELE